MWVWEAERKMLGRKSYKKKKKDGITSLMLTKLIEDRKKRDLN